MGDHCAPAGLRMRSRHKIPSLACAPGGGNENCRKIPTVLIQILKNPRLHSVRNSLLDVQATWMRALTPTIQFFSFVNRCAPPQTGGGFGVYRAVRPRQERARRVVQHHVLGRSRWERVEGVEWIVRSQGRIVFSFFLFCSRCTLLLRPLIMFQYWYILYYSL